MLYYPPVLLRGPPEPDPASQLGFVGAAVAAGGGSPPPDASPVPPRAATYPCPSQWCACPRVGGGEGTVQYTQKPPRGQGRLTVYRQASPRLEPGLDNAPPFSFTSLLLFFVILNF